MQKSSTRGASLAALFVTVVSAQTVTSYFPVCPTASSTTITLPTTVTFCPGPYCNGGSSGPMITAGPTNGVGMPGVNVGQYTSVGADGKTTVLGIWETVYDSMCDSGLVPATYTITAPCPCEETAHPTVLPTGFETTVVPCSVCAATGGPSTVTITQPCSTGPYATQTPTVEQSSAGAVGASAMSPSGAQASAVAAAAASAGANSGSGASSAKAMAAASAAASAQADSGAASASASAAAAAAASAQNTAGNSASTNTEVDAETAAGTGTDTNTDTDSAAAASASAHGAGVVNVVPLNGTMSKNSTVSSMTTPAPIASYVSSAGKTSLAGTTLFAAVLAIFLL